MCPLRLVASSVVNGRNYQDVGGTRFDSSLSENPRFCLQVVRMLFVIVVLFAVLWLPYRGLSLYNVAFAVKPYLDKWAMFMAKTCIFINSSINPILYNAMSKRFRKAFLEVLAFKQSKKTEARDRRYTLPAANPSRIQSLDEVYVGISVTVYLISTVFDEHQKGHRWEVQATVCAHCTTSTHMHERHSTNTIPFKTSLYHMESIHKLLMTHEREPWRWCCNRRQKIVIRVWLRGVWKHVRPKFLLTLNLVFDLFRKQL